MRWHPCGPQVFELRISSLKDVSVISRAEDYRALKAGGAKFVGGSGGNAAGAASRAMLMTDGDLLAGNRLFLQVGNDVNSDQS
jgi:hypothetical protein